jgi:glycine betaine/proline transport system ATP-binding protein
MGLSGSGKSTLVRCLSRLIEPTAGEILFDGRDLLAASEAELIEIRRHKMGMVFQHFACCRISPCSATSPFRSRCRAWPRSEARGARAGGDRARRPGRPRALLPARALRRPAAARRHRPLARRGARTLVPRRAVLGPRPADPARDAGRVLRLQRLLHKTIVFITHDFDEAIRLADRIAIMKDGARSIQIGTPEDLVLHPADRPMSRSSPSAWSRDRTPGACSFGYLVVFGQWHERHGDACLDPGRGAARCRGGRGARLIGLPLAAVRDARSRRSST